MQEAILLSNVVSTLALVGLIWTIQVDVYPLFARVGASDFVPFHAQHSRRITMIVAPLMLVELLSSTALVFLPPASLGRAPFMFGLALVVSTWLSTAVVQVPAHQALGSGFDAEVHARLVRSNWIRTVAWSLRGLLVVWVLARILAG